MSFPVYGITASDARLAVLNDTTDSSQDARLEAVLLAAIKQYENLCGGRSLVASSGTRYYKYNAVRDYLYLMLDCELVTLTSLTNGDSDGTSISTGDVVLLHAGSRNSGPPYDEIFWPDGDGFEIAGDSYYITVVGTWGYAAALDNQQKETLLSLLKYKFSVGDSQSETVTLMDGSTVTMRRGVPRDVWDAAKSDRRLANWLRLPRE